MKCHVKPRGRKQREDIDRAILEYLAEQDWLVTTEMVSKRLGISWNTAQTHLYKLMAEGKVKGRKIGRQNQWMLSREVKTSDQASKQDRV